MTKINPPLPAITLHGNGLNSPIKSQRLAQWIFKN